ncbi:MAG TPA: GAF domain-containing protein [Anaerolineales bacterium]|nr:GAF domain-containing protein [Anaerolineales bacterium]HNS59880.1 GAF domain-containing protein [Anaerolineales bacterium]
MLVGLDVSFWLISIAAVLLLLVLVVLWFRRLPENVQAGGMPNPAVEIPSSTNLTEAIVTVQPGGRVDYLNDLARDWFGLRADELPEIEKLIRKARPAEDFLNLCATHGQKRLSVGGRLVEATSYQVPGPYPLMFITMRSVGLAANVDVALSDSSMLKIISDFGRGVTESLDLDNTIYSILLNVSHLVPADVMEIKIWDLPRKTFDTYTLDPSGASKTMRAYTSQFGALTETLVARRATILIPDIRSANPEMAQLGEKSPVLSYIGLPLFANNELIGLLEFGHLSAGTLGQHDLDLLQLVSSQAGFGIQNARTYANEVRRSKELSGLVNLTQSVGVTQDYSSLINRLIDSISPLFAVDILGFLLYDANKRTLEGQVPFQGLPRHIVEIYRTTILPESPAEKVIQEGRLISTRNAADDRIWGELGLQTIAQAASLRESVLAPMIAGEQFVGFVQISNHKQASVEFSESELRLIETVASQAAGIIHNSFLVERTRQRAIRSDGLRRIANLSTSTAGLDEIVQLSVDELARLLRCDLVALFLEDQKSGGLQLHENSVFGVSTEAKSPLLRLHAEGVPYRATVAGTRKSISTGRLSLERNISSGYLPLFSRLQMESVLIVPVAVREKSLGELILGSRKTDFFGNYDLEIALAAAGQLADAIEDNSRFMQTDDVLRRRVEQLSSLARVSRELNTTQDLKSLLEVIRDEALRVTRAECGAILLFDSNVSSFPPSISLSIGCPLPSTFPHIEQTVIETGKPQLVEDYTENGKIPIHAGVVSALIVPILDQEKTVGLMHLHSGQSSFFDVPSLEIAQTLASQAAVAIGNVERFQKQRESVEVLRRRAETLSRLTEVAGGLNFENPLDQTLRAILISMCEATPFETALISVLEPGGLLKRITGVGFTPEMLNDLMARKQPLVSLQQMLKPQFLVSRSYFIPVDQAPIIPSDILLVTVNPASDTERSATVWDPDDLLIIPLEDETGNTLGIISVDSPRNGLRPDRATIESLEIFASQASIAILTYGRFTELRNKVDSLKSGLDRQERFINLTQKDLPILLRKDLDQTIAIHNLDHRGQRVRAGLAITESVSRQLDASSALQALGRETLTQLGMSVAMIAESTNEGPRLMTVLGNVTRSTNPEALFGQRNPLRACLQTGETILIPNVDENIEWRETPLLTALQAKSAICLPIKIDKRTVAAMLAVSREPMPAFTSEDRQVYNQIARQTSVILQNISLLNETRKRLQEVNLLLDFSRQLRGLDSDRIVRALLDSARRALPAAHAGVVLVWDEQTNQLYPHAVSGYADNDSMKRILYHPGESLPGQVFESRKALRVDEIQFTRDYLFSTESQLLYRQATGGRLPVSSLFIPVQSGDQPVGVLVLDNFNTPAAFTPEDEALLLSLSQQVGLSLQNVRLVRTTQERAAQLGALTDAATSLASSLQRNELIASLLNQLEPVIPYDTAALWLRERDKLTVAAAKGFPDTERRLGLTVAVEDSALFNEMIRTGQGILVGDVRQDARFPALEAPRLSWMGMPLISKNEVVGVLALEKWQAYYYTRDHIQVGKTFSSQAAVALENARLFEESISRATELDERSERLGLLNRFSSALSGLLDEGRIFQLTAEELLAAMLTPRVSVVTFERGNAVLKYDLPRSKSKLPTKLPDAPIFHRLKESLGVFTTDSVENEADLAPLSGFLGSRTKALLILPLVSGANLRALVFVHQGESIRFSVTEMELARTLTNQASIALENARLFQATVLTAERFSILNKASYEVGASLDPEQIYTAVHKAAQQLMPVESFVISLLDAESDEIEGAYLVDGNARSPSVRLPRSEGLSGHVISTGLPLLLHGRDSVEEIGAVIFGKPDVPISILAVPMTLGGKTVGMLSAQSYQPNVYTEEDLQILSTLANQAVVAIQNGRLFKETQRLAEELELRVVDRTAQLQREQQSTETLLRILTEVSSSLDLDRALNRTLALLNDAVGAEQGTIMLISAEDNLLHYRAGYGYLSDRVTAEGRGFTLKIGEGLAGWIVRHREPALINDLLLDDRWVKTATTAREHRSAIAMPLLVAEDVIGVLMVYHRKPNFFNAEMLSLVKAIAGQVAVAINNARLYELIRDQAERLGSMLRREQEDASRSQAILEAVADGVLVTDPNNRISFLNKSAEDILSLESGKVIGQTLDVFGGLFGKSAASWMQTINNWSVSPSSYQAGETFAEQLVLENGLIVLVHLAPVILQNDFLGTVSIFRDITHEVEVDRLKSEFVATVSHELRTPMTSIRGYVDVLLMGAAGAMNENQAHFLKIVKGNTERLNILVNDLLDISRLESGRVTLSPQALDLREVAEDVIGDVLRRSQEENKPIALSLDAPKKLPYVFGDAERVRQVLANLVDNAYHYTPENGTILVQLHPSNGGSEVQVDIKDNGVGIALGDQPRVFERFYRGEHPLVLATPGTGLGLSIVKELVEMHKGRIWVQSAGLDGEGSTFSFTLPVFKN